MSGDFILRHKVDRDFTVLPNRVLRDTRLRWSDRGLLAFLLHLPGNFKLNYVFLAKQAPDGVDAVSSCVRRLCSLRYVQIGALFAGAIGVALTGSPLDWVPAPACFADFGSTVSRLLYASYYSCAGGVAFVFVRVLQELLRGRRWRDAILEARRMPSIW